MLNRSLTFSIVAILFLLALQFLWLYRVIENEKSNFKEESSYLLNESIKKELYKRYETLNKGSNFRVLVSNSLEVDESSSSQIEQIDVGSRSQGVAEVAFEEVLQELCRDILPFNIDTLASLFISQLEERALTTSFSLNFISPDGTQMREHRAAQGENLLFKSSFELEENLTFKKDLTLVATINYPMWLFRGDLISILIASFAITLFILFSIVMQTKLLYREVSLAKMRESITHFLTHELRSPLQTSITNIEVAEMAEGESSSYFLAKGKEQLYFLNSLIENILEVNKFEKKLNLIKREWFNIEEAIAPHLARHKLKPTKELHFNYNIESGAERIFADKLHLSNAIGNLIDNAIKYSEQRVEVDIVVKQKREFHIISVEDNGIGIPKEEQHKIFEKFYRVGKREHSQKGKGFGLGLNYLQWVVKAHKGRVELESEVAVGTKFTLFIKGAKDGTENIVS